MTAIRQYNKFRLGNAFVIGLSMRYRYKTIVLAPNNQRRNFHTIKVSMQPGVIGELPCEARQSLPGQENTHDLLWFRRIWNDP